MEKVLPFSSDATLIYPCCFIEKCSTTLVYSFWVFRYRYRIYPAAERTKFCFHFSITGNLAPILQSNSLLILPVWSATTGAANSLSAFASMNVATSPTTISSASVMSTASWSMQIRPIIGTIYCLIRILPFPQDKFLGIPSAYPIGMMAIRLSFCAVNVLPYPTLSPLGTERISMTSDFRERTGRKSNLRTVSSCGELRTPYKATPVRT